MKRDVDAIARLQAVVDREGSQKAAALTLGVGESYFSDLINGRRKFSDVILAKLGLRRAVVDAR